MAIKTLDDLLNSEDYQNSCFGSSSDGWSNDADRMERVEEAAKFGGDGSTHGEHIQDWRDTLGWLGLDDEVKESISKEIDATEKWHVDNGSIDEQIG